MARSTLLLTVSVLFASLLTGCTSNFLNENDKLRETNQQLQDKVDELEKSIDLRLKEIETMKQSATQPASQIEGADVPRLVKINFDRYSGAVDTTHTTGVDNQLILYLVTQDQEGRFLPVSGQATVQAVDIRPNQPPATLFEKTYTAKEFDQAYRTGITGTHYTLEIPLPDKPPAGLNQLTIKVTFIDAATGAKLTAEQPFSVNLTPRK